ncbi:odorant receptor Or2-like isoform X2 [Atheta coriaria]|uniref:odorant receptor Or2-like isoform X2 n=1 Tax=Dalotia coriaria TaxID=877792 RepID=UPI0031F34348
MIMAKTFQFIVANLTTSSSIKPFMNAGLALHFTIFDLGNWYYPFHIYEIIAMINASYNNSTMDCVAMSLMSICGTQFEILKQKIIHCRQWAGRTTEEIDAGEVNVGEDMDPNLDVTIKQYLNSCVEHHIKILDIAGDVENIFCYLLLSQFAISVLAICNTWFQFMLEDNLIKILFLSFYALALLNQIALYCLYGDQVMQKSQDLRDACYMSDWYKSNKMVAKNMLLIMERAKRPTVITAGKLSVCNLVTYAGLIRMSYSYFALMNRLYGDMGE